MTLSILQAKEAFVVSANTVSVSFDNGVTSGSIVVIGAYSLDHNVTVGTITFSDANSDVFTDSGMGLRNDGAMAPLTASLTSQMGAFFKPTAGVSTFTATSSNATIGSMEIVIWEVAGFTNPKFDKVAAATGNGTAADSGPTGTLTAANEAALLFILCGGTPSGPGSGWVTGGGAAIHDGITGAGDITAHQITSATTFIDATGTQTSDGWVAWCVTLSDASFGILDMA